MRWLTVVLMLVTGASAAADSLNIDDSKLELLGVRFAPAKSVAEQYSRVLPGKVGLPVSQQHMISAPLSGRIMQINVSSGDAVASDLVITVLESSELLDLQRALLNAAGKHQLDSEAYKRDKTLFDEGIIAQRRLLEARYTFLQSTASLHESRQLLQIAGMSEQDIGQLETKQKLTNRLSIRAGVAGYILEQDIGVGDYVETGAPLFLVGQINPLWVLVDVPEELASHFSIGAPVTATGCGDTEGKLIAVGKSVDPISQTIQLRVEFSFKADTTPCLKPGQFVQARIKISQSEAIFEVPLAAAVHHNGETFLFVKGDSAIEPTVIEVLSRHGSMIRVGGKIDENTQIAVSGGAALKAAWLGMGGSE